MYNYPAMAVLVFIIVQIYLVDYAELMTVINKSGDSSHEFELINEFDLHKTEWDHD